LLIVTDSLVEVKVSVLKAYLLSEKARVTSSPAASPVIFMVLLTRLLSVDAVILPIAVVLFTLMLAVGCEYL
jgi:hypothetical protein